MNLNLILATRNIMAKPKLTIALSHYDRHVPFFDGTVQPEQVDLNVLIVGQSDRQRNGEERHERMLQQGEFDVAELSLSSYLMAKSRGMPFTAIPVFPRRLFSLSQMWVNIEARIERPFDLIGRKVGLHSFQNTLATLAKATCRASSRCHGARFIGCSAKGTIFPSNRRRASKSISCRRVRMPAISSNRARSAP